MGSPASHHLREARVKDAKIAKLSQLDEILHMRRGEIFGLSWDMVGFEGGVFAPNARDL
jgi:hypothetical protein